MSQSQSPWSKHLWLRILGTIRIRPHEVCRLASPAPHSGMQVATRPKTVVARPQPRVPGATRAADAAGADSRAVGFREGHGALWPEKKWD